MSAIPRAGAAGQITVTEPQCMPCQGLIFVALAAITITGIVLCAVKPPFVANNLIAFGASTGVVGLLALAVLTARSTIVTRNPSQQLPGASIQEEHEAAAKEAQEVYDNWDGNGPNPWRDYLETDYELNHFVYPERFHPAFEAMKDHPEQLLALVKELPERGTGFTQSAFWKALKEFDSNVLYWNVIALTHLEPVEVERNNPEYHDYAVINGSKTLPAYRQMLFGLDRVTTPENYEKVVLLLCNELVREKFNVNNLLSSESYSMSNENKGIVRAKEESLRTTLRRLLDRENVNNEVKKWLCINACKEMESFILTNEFGVHYLKEAREMYQQFIKGKAYGGEAEVKAECPIFCAIDTFDSAKQREMLLFTLVPANCLDDDVYQRRNLPLPRPAILDQDSQRILFSIPKQIFGHFLLYIIGWQQVQAQILRLCGLGKELQAHPDLLVSAYNLLKSSDYLSKYTLQNGKVVKKPA